ncbi:hypothetical protein D1B33_13165 [Lysinibacillus yapensis]|uniref:DUF2268 domain-containing protein n=1 Tax=Ureibacillus yapensis TaxID=2304605 RepID=A0A396SBZ2_9BACL|nr:DUF2268 domain-containing putative Zn-dependent protease [Lysinibacillus yapensis]RHW34988.1 hypothetical protein D1B33_13165 [Lysinibacillus yapensis]
MAVINTLAYLNKIIDLSKEKTGEELLELHREILCTPVKEYFPNASLEDLHFELLVQGLFHPSESEEIRGVVESLKAIEVWLTIQKEFERLKNLWKGPDVPVYIYPLTKERPYLEGFEVKKNGVAFNNVIFLFVTPELEEIELKALFAHEYHHACRLSFLNKAHQEMELLDSLLIEGMAESAVEELYGETWLSPWTKWYSQEEGVSLWRKYFVNHLRLEGVDRHQIFLFGNEEEGLPKWIGYCLGYQIVQSFLKQNGLIQQQALYKIPSKEILKNTEFHL